MAETREAAFPSIQEVLRMVQAHPPIELVAGETTVTLASVCVTCGGEGQCENDPPDRIVVCWTCNGSGYRITDSGRAILRLVALAQSSPVTNPLGTAIAETWR